MQIVIKLEQRDFEGNKEVFDRMYGLCSVLNKKTGPVEMTKAEVEKSANVVREEQTSDDTPAEDNTAEVLADNTPTEDKNAEVTTTEYTIEEVRKAFGEYAKSQGRDKAKGLLQEMGYDKVTEIPPERYTEAMTRIGDVK
ncbi:hypothetical protein DXA10_02365 [Firmicutes bacterium AM55-24TS]|jgi:hypothetical protein|nr:hypothetical protein DXA10_02365 [Firmicutes bacterium AM55-24TS]